MLTAQIASDLKQAQVARDVVRVSTLRLLVSEMGYARIRKGKELEDADVYALILREAKKRKEAAAGFRQGGREELAQREELELGILRNYLPAQMPDEELTKLISDTIKELGASSLVDLGKVIGAVLKKAGAGAEGAEVSRKAREMLGLGQH